MITGMENTLKADYISKIENGIQIECGHMVRTPNCISGLAKGLADTIIPFLVANVQVDPGQSVTVPGAGLLDSMSGPVSGIATGTVSTPGTIS